MDSIKVNFNCPVATVRIIDEMAKADHRDRTSMLNKIVDFYLSRHAKTTSNGTKRPTQKAESR